MGPKSASIPTEYYSALFFALYEFRTPALILEKHESSLKI